MLQQQQLFRRTNNVLSNKDLTKILPICGFLYGGSSNIKDEGRPFNIVLDSILDMIKVKKIPINIIPSTTIVDMNVVNFPFTVPAMNIAEIVIKNGKRPLQGTNAFVRIAISFSLGESIILVPTTPAALQPNPMHMVRACFP